MLGNIPIGLFSDGYSGWYIRLAEIIIGIFQFPINFKSSWGFFSRGLSLWRIAVEIT